MAARKPKPAELACPFCNGTQLEIAEQITCSTCWCSGPDPYNPNGFTGDWNTRGAETLPDRIVDAYPAFRLETKGQDRASSSVKTKRWRATLTLRSKAVNEECDFEGEGDTQHQALTALSKKLAKLKAKETVDV